MAQGSEPPGRTGGFAATCGLPGGAPRRWSCLFTTLLFGLLHFPAAYAEDAPTVLLPRPEVLQPAITFWQRVYAEIDSNQGFLHDDRYMDVVYTILDLPSDSRAQRAVIATARKQLIADLRAIARKGTASGARQRQLLKLWAGRKEALAGAAGRVRFQRGTADRFQAGLVRSGRWTAHIEEALKRNGVPSELVALPHIESSFNPVARSYVGASGMWQFTRDTGRQFMRIDGIVDERLDPFFASDAAAQMLRMDYEKVGHWPLAVTGYNHGVNGMVRAKEQLGTSDIGEIVQRYRSSTFGFSSRNFYAGFLAASEIHGDPNRWFGTVKIDSPEEPSRLTLPGWFGAADLARAAGVSLDVLRDFNPALLDSVWAGSKFVPSKFPLRVPGPTVKTLEGSLLELTDHGGQRPDEMHRVRRGEALSTIASRYGTSVRQIMALNGIRNPNRIRAGMRLKLPVSPASGRAARRASRGAAAPRSAGRVYVVRSGDRVGSIARRYGVREKDLVALNHLADPTLIFPGQKLTLPAAAGAGPAVRPTVRAAPGQVYVVRSGDVVGSIARRYGVEEKDLAALNHLADPTLIFPGQKLTLRPAAGAGPVVRPTVRAAPGRVHVVRSGDVVGSIARRYGVPERDLVALNHLADPTLIFPGQKLTVPAAARAGAGPAVRPAASGGVHVVRSGDLVGSIARRYGVRETDLVTLNALVDPAKIYPGQKLILPAGGRAVAKSVRHQVRTGESLSDIASRYGVSLQRLMSLNGIRNPDRLRAGTVLKIARGG